MTTRVTVKNEGPGKVVVEACDVQNADTHPSDPEKTTVLTVLDPGNQYDTYIWHERRISIREA